jgi:hypothetical protein
MSEANGEPEYTTGNSLVDAALRRLQAKNDARFRDIEDAMLVQGHLEKGMSERLKRHAEFIAVMKISSPVTTNSCASLTIN